MNRIASLVCLLTILFSCADHRSEKYDLVISNVGLFDGTKDHGVVNVAIHGDTIAKISKDFLSGDSVIDGKGKYIIPGLINAHIHATKPEDLQNAIRIGVIAVIDLHQSSEERAAKLRSYRDSTTYASFYSAGFSATLPGGHPTQYGPIETISDSLSASEWVQNRLDHGADFIKIIRDGGGGPPDFEVIPTLDFKQISQIIEGAKEKNLLSLAHTVTLDETMEIARLGINGFAHLWMGNESATDEQLKALKDYNVFIIPTAQTQQKIWELVQEGPPPMQEYATQFLSSMELIKNEIARIHAAGIPILAGNDPPNFDINYGTDLLKEMQLYSDAGLSNIEVLQTATGNPSRIFKLDGVGTIVEGQPATIILLNGNPLENLNDLNKIQNIWKNGVIVK